MHGYLLFRVPSGEVARIEAERSARKALIRLLEETVPAGTEVLGLVIDVDAPSHLQAASA